MENTRIPKVRIRFVHLHHFGLGFRSARGRTVEVRVAILVSITFRVLREFLWAYFQAFTWVDNR